jgi:hypothetical protein
MTLEQVMELCKAWHPQMTEREVIEVMSRDIENDWLKSRWVRSNNSVGCERWFLWYWY